LSWGLSLSAAVSRCCVSGGVERLPVCFVLEAAPPGLRASPLKRL